MDSKGFERLLDDIADIDECDKYRNSAKCEDLGYELYLFLETLKDEYANPELKEAYNYVISNCRQIITYADFKNL